LHWVEDPRWEKAVCEKTEKGKTLRKRMFLLTFAFVGLLITKWQRRRNCVWNFLWRRANNYKQPDCVGAQA
jgi:hypothetical protein